MPMNYFNFLLSRLELETLQTFFWTSKMNCKFINNKPFGEYWIAHLLVNHFLYKNTKVY